MICASIYEYEMRQNLRQIQIPEEKIISGKVELENLLKYPDIFDSSKIIAFQNQKISFENQEILENIRKIISRNRFKDMSNGLEWMKGLSLVAGGMAVGYDYMYVMLRILHAKKPRSILEMGLGQTSKILARFQKETNCSYDIVEQDENWYKFFKNELDLSDKACVHIKPMKQVYNTVYNTEVNCFTDFESVILRKKFDFISIDGPFGGNNKLSRADILPYIPQCLKESFSIMLDDCAREGEKNMVRELEDILRKNQIEYHKVVYGEDKQFALITSTDNSFLCSLY